MATQSRHERGHSRHQTPAGAGTGERPAAAILAAEITDESETTSAPAWESGDGESGDSFTGQQGNAAGTSPPVGTVCLDETSLDCIREAACAFRDAAYALRDMNGASTTDMPPMSAPLAHALTEIAHAIRDLAKSFGNGSTHWSSGSAATSQPQLSAAPLQVAPEPSISTGPLTPFQAMQNMQAMRAFAQTGRTQLQEAVRLISAFETSAG